MTGFPKGTKFIASYSGGKDSVLAIHRAVRQGMELQALIITYNTDLGRSWFHGIPEEVLRQVEASVGAPVILIKTTGEAYNQSFEDVLRHQKELGAQVCVFGDIDIPGHLEWGKARCEAAGLSACFPLWQENREDLVRECVEAGFVPRITVVNTEKMSAEFLGRPITEELIAQLKEQGVDVCGENGEYHSFVTEGPIFQKAVAVEFAPPLEVDSYRVLPVKIREKSPVLEQGYVQVYTGNGKGKTTAAMGLTLRAAGAGMKVYFGQFMKQEETSEKFAMENFLGESVTFVQFGDGHELRRPNPETDGAAAQKGYLQAREALLSGRYDLVVLDEINVAARLHYLTEEQLLALMAEKPRHTELVFTGRGAPEAVQQKADLVTEMVEHRHYFRAGVPARKGVEL